MNALLKTVDVCRHIEYFNCVLKPPNLFENFKLMPLGLKLLDNIQRQWLLANRNMLHNSEQLLVNVNGFKYLSNDSNDKLKALSANITSNSEDCIQLNSSDSKVVSNQCFLIPGKRSYEHFNVIQRQHKIWYKKFLAKPQQIMVTEPKSSEDGIRSSNIQSVYDFGKLNIIRYNVIPALNNHHVNSMEANDQQYLIENNINAIVIASLSLVEAVVDLILNGLGDLEDSSPQSLYIHRYLAPIQCNIISACKDESWSKPMFYLCERVRMALEDTKRITVGGINEIRSDEEYYSLVAQDDAKGVPYNIVVTENTLKTGFLDIRNRDTTLLEKFYCSEVDDYFLKLFRGCH